MDINAYRVKRGTLSYDGRSRRVIVGPTPGGNDLHVKWSRSGQAADQHLTTAGDEAMRQQRGAFVEPLHDFRYHHARLKRFPRLA